MSRRKYRIEYWSVFPDEHDMNTTKGEELLIKDNCKAIVQRLAEERDVLLDCSLKDYQNLPSLQELAESLSDQLKHNQSFIQNLLSALTETREATESLNNVIIDKIERESVHSWLPHTDLAGMHTMYLPDILSSNLSTAING